MYLNDVGIRKNARFTGASSAGVLKWIRKAHQHLAEQLRQASQAVEGQMPDVIGMDKIYIFVQKPCRAVIWVTHSRTQRRVVAYLIGDKGVSSAIELYEYTCRIVPSITPIRDNPARFNGRFKRFSKSWETLAITFDMFFHRHLLPSRHR